jgi:hypothetical protein
MGAAKPTRGAALGERLVDEVVSLSLPGSGNVLVDPVSG